MNIIEQEPITLDGREGIRYWVSDPFTFCDNAEVNDRLSSYPIVVFQPNRPAQETPVLLAIQGIAAPYWWSAFILPTLLDRGIAVVMLQPPLGGERSFSYSKDGKILKELGPIYERKVPLDITFFERIMACTARDIREALALAAHHHGLVSDRLALFGISLGALQAGYAFICDGIGARYLAAIGHCDGQRFASSYTPCLAGTLAASPVGTLVEQGLAVAGYNDLAAVAPFMRITNRLSQDTHEAKASNPLTYADRVHPNRKARFLVGAKDPLVRLEDVHHCSKVLPDAEVFVVPEMTHGGARFTNHVCTFLQTQLGDWTW